LSLILFNLLVSRNNPIGARFE